MECVIVILFFQKIDKCYIDHIGIKRPANTWISTHSQVNNIKYLISPMDYYLSYSSNVNLLHPDLATVSV